MSAANCNTHASTTAAVAVRLRLNTTYEESPTGNPDDYIRSKITDKP